MNLKTRKKNRIRKINLKFRKGALRCSEEVYLYWNTDYDEAPRKQEETIIFINNRLVIIDKDSKIPMHFKRKGNFLEKQFIVINPGERIRAIKARKKIIYPIKARYKYRKKEDVENEKSK